MRRMCGPGWPGVCSRSSTHRALVIDDTGFLKDGNASACVTRQHTGTAGKVTKLPGRSFAAPGFQRRLGGGELASVPAGSWDPASPKADPAKVARRDKCAVPAEVGHIEKWQPALDMIDETRSWGIEVPQVIADGGYGDTTAFRLGLEERNLDYVVGISTTTTARPEDAQLHTPAYPGRGPRPVPAYPEPARRVKDLVIAAGKRAARPVQRREGSRPGSGRSGVKRMYPPPRSPADPARRTRDLQGHGRRRASGPLAAGRMARRPGRACAVLAVQPARNHPVARPRAHREAPPAKPVRNLHQFPTPQVLLITRANR
jgi:hypothetical protein